MLLLEVLLCTLGVHFKLHPKINWQQKRGILRTEGLPRLGTETPHDAGNAVLGLGEDPALGNNDYRTMSIVQY